MIEPLPKVFSMRATASSSDFKRSEALPLRISFWIVALLGPVSLAIVFSPLIPGRKPKKSAL
jgi:hypothetical protein